MRDSPPDCTSRSNTTRTDEEEDDDDNEEEEEEGEKEEEEEDKEEEAILLPPTEEDEDEEVEVEEADDFVWCSTCRCVLMVSMGYMVTCSIKPAIDPAAMCVHTLRPEDGS